MNQSNTFWCVALLALPLSVFALIIIWPLLSSYYYGFTNWNGFIDNYDFVGFENFGKLFSDRVFMSAAINTIIWMAIAVVLPTILGLSLALLTDSNVPGGPIFKTIFYLPICLLLWPVRFGYGSTSPIGAC